MDDFAYGHAGNNIITPGGGITSGLPSIRELNLGSLDQV
jgi:hypothetical protein